MFIIYFAGISHTGCGHTQVNNLFAVCNMPSISAVSLSKKERKMSAAIDKIAKQSCQEAQAEEMRLSSDNGVQNIESLTNVYAQDK